MQFLLLEVLTNNEKIILIAKSAFIFIQHIYLQLAVYFSLVKGKYENIFLKVVVKSIKFDVRLLIKRSFEIVQNFKACV